jgi:hypothetical protein
MRVKLWAAVLALPAAAALAAAAGPAVAGTVNPNTVNPNTVRPQISRTYCGHGVWVVSTFPAKGFNPLTATTAELNANNYPLRPPASKKSEYAQWKKFAVKPAATRSSCPRAPRGTAAEGKRLYGTDTAWSGYVVHNDTFTDAEAEWTLPSVSGVAGTDDYSFSWVGLGLGENDTDALIQAGSESNYLNGTDQYELWYEVFPQENSQPLTNASPGDLVGAHVSIASNGIAEFHVWDDTSGYNEEIYYPGSFVNDGHAEWIYERPCFENSGGTECVVSYLADAAPTFTQAQAAVSGVGWLSLGALDNYTQTMYNCPGTQVLALPGGITGNGLTYSDTYEHHGDDDCQATI